MTPNYQRLMCGAFLLVGILLFQPIPTLDASKGMILDQAYPGLASKILGKARLDKLEKGIVLKTDDFQIDEDFLDQFVKGTDPDLRQQYEKNLFVIMEQQAIEKVLFHEARKSGLKKDGPANDLIASFVKEKVSHISVSDMEIWSFYEENKASLEGTSFEQAKEWIGEYLVERKRDEAVLAYVSTLVDDLNIRVDTDWTQKQSKMARDNPVDRARFSGKPTLVEFGATGCGPCDLMQPILEDLRQKFRGRLNIIFVHVGEEPILITRYGIDLIPVQVFFDKDGNEFFRHVGFFSQGEIEKQLAGMGVL